MLVVREFMALAPKMGAKATGTIHCAQPDSSPEFLAWQKALVETARALPTKTGNLCSGQRFGCGVFHNLEMRLFSLRVATVLP